MALQDKLPIEEIKKLADDIRTINGFVENHGFDGSLFSVDVTPNSETRARDWPLIGIFIAICVCLGLVLLKIFGDFNGNWSIGLLVITLVSATTAIMCTHLRFDNNAVTIIAGVGIIAFVAIGFGIMTPKEAIEKAEQLTR